MTKEAEILSDRQKAGSHTEDYSDAVHHDLYAKGLILTSAMQKFAEFTKLPESSSKLGAWFDTAFKILSLIQPELFLAKLLVEDEKAVTLALAIARQAGHKGAKALHIAQKAGAGVGVFQKGRETVTGIQESFEKATAPNTSGMTQLATLDAAKAPIFALIESGKKAKAIASLARQALDQEMDNRLNAPNAVYRESLEAMSKRLLKIPPSLREDELRQLEFLYLFYMIGEFVKSNVVVVETQRIVQIIGATSQREVRGGVSYSISGLNDTQQDTILGYFGIGGSAPRGRIFFQPMFFTIWMAMNVWGAGKSQRTEYSTQLTASARM